MFYISFFRFGYVAKFALDKFNDFTKLSTVIIRWG